MCCSMISRTSLCRAVSVVEGIASSLVEDAADIWRGGVGLLCEARTDPGEGRTCVPAGRYHSARRRANIRSQKLLTRTGVRGYLVGERAFGCGLWAGPPRVLAPNALNVTPAQENQVDGCDPRTPARRDGRRPGAGPGDPVAPARPPPPPPPRRPRRRRATASSTGPQGPARSVDTRPAPAAGRPAPRRRAGRCDRHGRAGTARRGRHGPAVLATAGRGPGPPASRRADVPGEAR